MIALAHDAVTRALSPRQTEVARLVADGLTDKQIAEALAIQPKSVTRLIARIRRNLALDRRKNLRVQITRWVVRAA